MLFGTTAPNPFEKSATNRMDGPNPSLICLMVVGEPLMSTGPTLKYDPINGNCAPTRGAGSSGRCIFHNPNA